MAFRLRFRRRSGTGAPPGSLVADPAAPVPQISFIAYGRDRFEERALDSAAEVAAVVGSFPVVWINVDGLGDAETVRAVGAAFGLHPLALEDVLNTHQRAKVEPYPGILFTVARMLRLGEKGVDNEQVSYFLGQGFLVTFQEGRPGDVFEPVRARLRSPLSPLRELGADMLLYALVDAVVDHYFPILEGLGERLDAIEDRILSHEGSAALRDLRILKRDLLELRRAAWPLRDAVQSLLRESTPLVHEETRLFLRDCHDHAAQILDLTETDRELAANLMDLYHAEAGQRLNEVMKVLTLIATIFMPLSFIASVYGMNFDTTRSPWNMPELKWVWGYPFALGLMAAVAGGLLFYFRKKGWFGRKSLS